MENLEEATIEDRLSIASSFILQAPPGEINDVFNDLRPVVGDDSQLETGLLPALSQYNTDQFTLVELPNSTIPAIICPAARVLDSSIDNRYYDPNSNQSFTFDHLRLCTTDLESYEAQKDEIESFRIELRKALDEYVQDHFTAGVFNVFALRDQKLYTILRREEGLKRFESTPVEEKEGDEPKGNDEDDGKDEKVGSEDDEKDKEDDNKKPEEEENASSSTVEPSDLEKDLYSAKFQVYVVGSKYNPTNYWTGRWRSSYEIDLGKSQINGEIQVNVHYYEQGNVQLSTNSKPRIDLKDRLENFKDEEKGRGSIIDEIIKVLIELENKFQNDLNLKYLSLGDETFKVLRRNLPITKQKINWNQINSRIVINDKS